jgi:drug/metabolite transporter superfamily protein YnfA
MWTDRRTGTVVAIMLSAALLLWPAFWNGYPLVFADTGTYLSQAIERYAGWDRPIFYSLFLLPLHLTLTTWPVIAVQALLVAHVLHLVRRTLLPEASAFWLLPLSAVMALLTSLPWFTAPIMPDVFTGLLVLVLVLLVRCPDDLSGLETVWLSALAAVMIAAHQSHVPLALVLLAALLPLSGRMTPWGVAPLALAVIALVSVNLLAFGRPSLSPFGNVFLLTRVIYDGPGADVLRRDCPAAGWRLCAFVDRLPPIADDFLWRKDGPVVSAGGAKLVSQEADAIIAAALRPEPGRELLAFARNTARQLAMFATGDGLQAWPETVTPVIARDFPQRETNAYLGARQSGGGLPIPAALQTLHVATALAGIGGCILLLCVGRRGKPSAFAAAVLLALLANAAITGGLSGPHDRYQSRIMWLPSTKASARRACLPARSGLAFVR